MSVIIDENVLNETRDRLISQLKKDKFYIIDEIMIDKKTYKNFIEYIYNYFIEAIEIKEIREFEVKFKFNRDEPRFHKMQLRHFLTNIILWEAFPKLGDTNIDASNIIDCTKISSRYLENYINEKIIKVYRDYVDSRKMSRVLHDILFNLSRISTDFNIILGMSISIEGFIDVSKKSPRFNEIIRTELDTSLQPSEIETILDDLLKEEVEILKTIENPLKPLLNSGSGVKTKQLAEMTISGGYKPDISGNTIPIPINSNLLVGGLKNVTNYYIDSNGGRKAIIMNKTVMGSAGHFARKVSLLAMDVNLSKSGVVECNTVNPIKLLITSKKFLNKYVGRYYREEGSLTYKILKGDEFNLIDKYIYIRSPITCTCHDGICKKCYGDTMFHLNKNICVGAYASAIITNPVSQGILSSKHLLTTISKETLFNDKFSEFFTLEANEIIINKMNDEMNRYKLVIIHDNIMSLGDLDVGEFSNFITLFHVEDTKTGEMFEMKELNDKDLFLSNELMEAMNMKRSKEVYSMRLSDLPETKLFVMQIENNELTKPLYNIMGLMDTKKRRDIMNINTINDLVQKMIELLIESDINVMAIHAETILRPLIRSSDNVLERPDFSDYDALENYDILTMSTALEKHPSASVGLTFQYLERQLLSPLTFMKKEDSCIDPFFEDND